MASWQGGRPHVDNPLVAVFAGNHGVVAQGVSPFPASVTQAMVANFQSGGAAINQICKTFDLSLKVYELALSQPTGDITAGPALDERGCAATMAFGMEALAGAPDLLALGEMGIGNTTVAAAIYCALFGGEAEEWVGRGTGVDDAGLKRKADAVRRALASTPAVSTIRWKCCAGSAAARSRRWPGRSWRRGISARRSCSTASSSAPPPPCCMRPTPPRSTIALRATSRPRTRTRARCVRSTRRRC